MELIPRWNNIAKIKVGVCEDDIVVVRYVLSARIRYISRVYTWPVLTLPSCQHCGKPGVKLLHACERTSAWQNLMSSSVVPDTSSMNR